jgi:hypothetical protein
MKEEINMLTKIKLYFYDIKFWIYGKLAKRYWDKAKLEPYPWETKWEKKAWKYIEKRENILAKEFELKGLV